MKKLLWVLLAFASLWVPLARAAEHPAIHGMLAFGREHIYLSHLPMFHSPHDYQAIAEAELESAVKANFVADQARHVGQNVYTLVPQQTFLLPDKMRASQTFKASLYRGHFERGGVVIARNVNVKIKQVVYFKRFDASAAKPDALSYLLFGHENELFMAHLIVAKPNFDHVMAVDVPWLNVKTLLEKAPYIVAQGQQSDGEPLPKVGGVSMRAAQDEGSVELDLTPLREIYLEFDDLAG
jgi:hypothetical protein